MIDANPPGNPVQRNTSTKTSQTWLASHTGPITRSMSDRAAPPLRVAGGEVPHPAAEVGPREHRVGEHADEQQRGDGVGERHAAPPRAVRRGQVERLAARHRRAIERRVIDRRSRS